MRIATHGIARQGEGFSFSYEGDRIEASPGESIAAALISANRLACRTTRSGEPRGVYCGMGVCGECSVIVDGRPGRACMEMAAPGISVERQPALRVLPEVLDSDSATADSYSSRDIDVLVIGAGPAGLAAARAAALSGATVLLVDERAKAGGQYFKQPGYGFAVDETRIDAQFREGLALYRSAMDAGVEFCFGATVWGAFPGPQLAISTASGSELLNAGRVVVSPGAYESPMPFPGWTLPGVMTTGAAQTLLRAYQTAPGQRVLVAGNGPLNLQVARELTTAGVQVVAVLELAKAPSLRKTVDVLQMCLTSPGLVRSGLGHVIRLARSRVPVLYQHRVIQAQGDERVESVTIARVDEAGLPIAGSEQQFAVDAVCLGYGFLAQSEIARALGAGLGLVDEADSSQTQKDIAGRSATAPEVFVAGDAGGLGGARVAISQGALAGATAARDLGYQADAAVQRNLQKDQRTLARHRRFQKALWSVYEAPTATLAVADEQTIICRCESVTLGRIQAQAAQGVTAIGAIKRETRAGMGRCQGRYCAGLLRQIVGDADAAIAEEQAYFAPRPPFKPLSIGSLAAVYNPMHTFDRTAGAEHSKFIPSDAVVRADLP
ncbi:MAG: NADPH-dependent 2,4-dienoyl-CoA reductase/sulfur reductase-like enzyme [Glaciecola sp.]|jgi:NADPH-dependent 2,4-dienoyl-CoA reductase/sulfur reductase-like enzyme